MLEFMIEGALSVLNMESLLLCFFGVFAGIVFGACPGISTTMGIALMLPFTYSMDIGQALALLIGLYIGGVSGGLISAILLNIPGTPGSVCTTFDGHPMSARGESGKALGVGILYSFVGGIISLVILMIFSPMLSSVAIRFTAVEYFAITLFSFLLVAGLTGKSVVKGLLSTVLGVMFTTVGAAPIDSVLRFTFGNNRLNSGFQLITVVIGFYAVSAVLKVAEYKQPPVEVLDYKMKGFGVTRKEFVQQTPNCVRSSLIGTFVGLLPGLGANIANVIAYSTAKSNSKYPEKFGTGIVDGIVASESSNNAVTGGALIPLLTLGIPGEGATALLLAALIIQGVQPGPLLFENQPVLVYSIFALMLIANIAMVAIEYFGIRAFLKIITVPAYYLFPIILIICCVGSFSSNNQIFDVYAIVLFAVVAFILRKMEYPLPPFILGFVLGELFETNMRRAIQFTGGTLEGWMEFPIALSILAVTAVALVYIIVKSLRKPTPKEAV